jgi:hypothetical protein
MGTEMLRAVPPPDFRYVGLQPCPTGRSLALFAAGAGIGTFGVGLALAGAELGTLALAGAAGACTAMLVGRGRGPLSRGLGLRQVAMAIVPWGVRVDSELGLRLLRWAAVRSVNVDFVHEMDHATPSTRWSLVTIETDQELLGGRAAGGVSLECLEAHVRSYADEAARPVALDLDGQRPLEPGFEPAFEQLLCEARRMLHAGDLGERLQLPPGSYREAGSRRSTARACELLRLALVDCRAAAADPRPLAAVLAAELGETRLLETLCSLSACPHPLVAAVCRAAALRLGADVKRIGAVEEVCDFVADADLRELGAWARGSA